MKGISNAEYSRGGYVEVIADGTKTWSQIFSELKAQINHSKVRPISSVTYGEALNYRRLAISTTNSSEYRLENIDIINSEITLSVALLRDTNSAYVNMTASGAYSDLSNGALDSGTVVRFYY